MAIPYFACTGLHHCLPRLAASQAVRLAAEVLGSAEERQRYDARGLAALGGSKYKLLQDFMAKGETVPQRLLHRLTEQAC